MKTCIYLTGHITCHHAPGLLAAELHALVPEVPPTSELLRTPARFAVSSSMEDSSKSLSSSDSQDRYNTKPFNPIIQALFKNKLYFCCKISWYGNNLNMCYFFYRSLFYNGWARGGAGWWQNSSPTYRFFDWCAQLSFQTSCQCLDNRTCNHKPFMLTD